MHTEPLKVLHVIARMNIGGTSKYLITLLPKLNSENCKTLLLTGDVQLGELENHELQILNFKRIKSLGRRVRLVSDLKSYFAIRRVIDEFKPTIIHSHTFKAGLLCRLMYFKIPKVHTFHGHLLTDPEFSKNAKRIIVLIEKILALTNQILIVTGERVAAELLEKGIGSPRKYKSIPGEVDSLDLESRQAARLKLGLTDEFTILWVARLAKVKNPNLLADVARLLPNCTFLMVGDGNEMETLKATAPSNLKILGFVDVKEILSAGDVFLSTSSNEGFPYSLVEAQMAGLPIVAVNVGAIQEIVTDGVDGYLVSQSSEEIALRIRELLANPNLLESMSLSAKKSAESRSRVQYLVVNHLEVYKTILEQDRR